MLFVRADEKTSQISKMRFLELKFSISGFSHTLNPFLAITSPFENVLTKKGVQKLSRYFQSLINNVLNTILGILLCG